jgi:predicted alpha/beta-hydrolase family hydrolase
MIDVRAARRRGLSDRGAIVPSGDAARWSVVVDGDRTTAVLDPAAAADATTVFVFAHGAGGHMGDRGVTQMSGEFCRQNFHVVRFNFLYREKRSSRPDPMPRLQQCFAAVVDRVRDELRPECLIIGGRSMGGRAASMLAAAGFTCDGLLLLAYPLHPAGRPEQLRDAHLPRIGVPVLCFNGTRDALCRVDLMERALQTVKTDWEMRWIEGADHSFHVLKSTGRTDAAVRDEIARVSASWRDRLLGEAVRQSAG